MQGKRVGNNPASGGVSLRSTCFMFQFGPLGNKKNRKWLYRGRVLQDDNLEWRVVSAESVLDKGMYSGIEFIVRRGESISILRNQCCVVLVRLQTELAQSNIVSEDHFIQKNFCFLRSSQSFVRVKGKLFLQTVYQRSLQFRKFSSEVVYYQLPICGNTERYTEIVL